MLGTVNALGQCNEDYIVVTYILVGRFIRES